MSENLEKAALDAIKQGHEKFASICYETGVGPNEWRKVWAVLIRLSARGAIYYNEDEGTYQCK